MAYTTVTSTVTVSGSSDVRYPIHVSLYMLRSGDSLNILGLGAKLNTGKQKFDGGYWYGFYLKYWDTEINDYSTIFLGQGAPYKGTGTVTGPQLYANLLNNNASVTSWFDSYSTPHTSGDYSIIDSTKTVQQIGITNIPNRRMVTLIVKYCRSTSGMPDPSQYDTASDYWRTDFMPTQSPLVNIMLFGNGGGGTILGSYNEGDILITPSFDMVKPLLNPTYRQTTITSTLTPRSIDYKIIDKQDNVIDTISRNLTPGTVSYWDAGYYGIDYNPVTGPVPSIPQVVRILGSIKVDQIFTRGVNGGTAYLAPCLNQISGSGYKLDSSAALQKYSTENRKLSVDKYSLTRIYGDNNSNPFYTFNGKIFPSNGIIVQNTYNAYVHVGHPYIRQYKNGEWVYKSSLKKHTAIDSAWSSQTSVISEVKKYENGKWITYGYTWPKTFSASAEVVDDKIRVYVICKISDDIHPYIKKIRISNYEGEKFINQTIVDYTIDTFNVDLPIGIGQKKYDITLELLDEDELYLGGITTFVHGTIEE